MAMTNQFFGWLNENRWVFEKFSAGTWLAIDANNNIIDEDSNSNQLVGRVDALPPATKRQIRIIYIYPPIFV
jgi:hypothetical protein